MQQKKELAPVCVELGIDENELMKIEINVSKIESMRVEIVSQIETLEKNNELKLNINSNLTSLTSIPDLLAAHKFIQDEITEL